MRNILFLWLLACSFVGVFAEDNGLFFKNYLDRMGLERKTILYIQQDSQGLIWFSTEYGLFRFDGHDCISLKQVNKEAGNAIGASYIPNFFIDKHDRLIVCNGFVYNVKSNEFLGAIYEKRYGSEVCQDILGQLWIPLKNDELLCENMEKGTKIVLKNRPFKVCNVTRTYYYYLSPDGALKRCSLTQPEVEMNVMDIPLQETVSQLCCIDDRNILLGTDRNELYYLNLEKKKLVRLISGIYVRDIAVRNSSECWIASETGLYIYNIMNGKLSHIQKKTFDTSALQDNVIYSLYKDNCDGMWLGHYFKGLSYQPHRACDFKVYQPDTTPHGMSGNVVREFCPDGRGNLWIGTEDNGLNCMDLTNNRLVCSLNESVLGTSNVHALCMVDDKLWFGSFDHGIGVLDLKSHKVVRHFQKGDGSGLNDNFVLSIINSKQRGVLVGTPSGVLRWDSNRFEPISPVSDSCRFCFQLFEDSYGRLWMNSSQEVLCESMASSVHSYAEDGCNINHIMEDSFGNIWMASTKGLLLLDKESGKVKRISLSDNEVTNRCCRIEEDDNHALWISTMNGLVYYNRNKGLKRVFTKTDGLPSNIFNVSSSYKDARGNLYFGTIDGMVMFNPHSLSFSSSAPRLVFSRLMAISSALTDTVYGGDLQKEPIEFHYRQNSISIDFASVQYDLADGQKFRYQLKGLENKWHQIQDYNTILYPSLPSGNYVLRLQSTDDMGNWAPDEIQYAFRINPPFYRTGWAYTLYILIFLGICLQTVRTTRKKVIRRHNRELEKLGIEKEKEIYRTKINFFTTIVHEIRTPLTLIKAPLESIIEQNGGKDSNLKIVEKNVVRLNDLCTQLLDFRKMESAQMQLNFVMENIPDLVSDVWFRFSGLMNERGLSCVNNFKEQPFQAAVDKEAFTKIISNLFNNACKYAKSRIEIDLHFDEQNFYLSIKNDGQVLIGENRSKIFNMFFRAEADKNKQGSGVGLPFSRSLAEMHNGSLTLVDNTENMTEFLLTLPLKQRMVMTHVHAMDESEPIEDDEMIPEISGSDKRKCILLVEDERDMRLFIKKQLSADYLVLDAANGLIALRILGSRMVDLVITDVMMPKMDGCELCREIKNRVEWCDIPVIMLTAKVNVEARLEGYSAGAEEYIDKPFSLKYLLERIRSILVKAEKVRIQSVKIDESSFMKRISGRSDRAFVERFMTLVSENIGNEKLEIEFLAKEMGISSSTLYRKVKQLTDCSPVDHIRKVRLAKAEQLLLVEQARISDVAYEVGFSTPSYFTICFTKQYGMSPTEFIRQNRSKG